MENDTSRYDIELQMEDTHELPKRSRYYHAVMAVDDLKKGSRYNVLKPRYVIFICPFDLMGLGEPVYRFQMLDLCSQPLANQASPFGSLSWRVVA